MKCSDPNCRSAAHFRPLVVIWAKDDPKHVRARTVTALDYPVCPAHATVDPKEFRCEGEALDIVTQQLRDATLKYWSLQELLRASGKAAETLPADPGAHAASVEPDLDSMVIQHIGNLRAPLEVTEKYLALPKDQQTKQRWRELVKEAQA